MSESSLVYAWPSSVYRSTMSANVTHPQIDNAVNFATTAALTAYLDEGGSYEEIAEASLSDTQLSKAVRTTNALHEEFGTPVRFIEATDESSSPPTIDRSDDSSIRIFPAYLLEFSFKGRLNTARLMLGVLLCDLAGIQTPRASGLQQEHREALSAIAHDPKQGRRVKVLNSLLSAGHDAMVAPRFTGHNRRSYSRKVSSAANLPADQKKVALQSVREKHEAQVARAIIHAVGKSIDKNDPELGNPTIRGRVLETMAYYARYRPTILGSRLLHRFLIGW